MPSMSLRSASNNIDSIIHSLPHDPKSSQIRSILSSGRISSLHSCYDNRQHQQQFGSHFFDVPRITTYNYWSENKRLQLQELRELLFRDLIVSQAKAKGPSTPYFIPPRSPEDDALSATRLLMNIAKPLKQGPGMISNLPVPSLAARCPPPSALNHLQGVLRRTSATANICPYLQVVDLHHDDAIGASILLLGRKLWVFWPPTPHNLAVLAKGYTGNRGPDGQNLRIMGCHEELQGGVAVIQHAGTTFWVPPFCPHVTVTLQTSVLFGYEVYTAAKFPVRLRNLPLFFAWNEWVGYGGYGEIQNLVKELTRHLELVLHGEERHARVGTLRVWDEVKDQFWRCGKESAHIIAKMKKVWKDFLGLAGKGACSICGERTEMRTGLGKRRADNHFEAVHWGLSARKRVKR